MANAKNLGTLTSCSVGLGLLPPSTLKGIEELAAKASLSDAEIGERAVREAAEAPSIWFVNFPNEAASNQREKLATYMQHVLDYRSWASLVWWRTVAGNSLIPQDTSLASVVARSSYCARVAGSHMRQTPWLAMKTDHNMVRNIYCRVTEFHGEVLKAVLYGFVGVTAAVVAALEAILQSLSTSIERSSEGESINKMMVCEYYEYYSAADVIRSNVRLVAFTVTKDMSEVKNAKKTETYISTKIEYNEYDATFNNSLWLTVAKEIEESQIKDSLDFVNQQTFDVPP